MRALDANGDMTFGRGQANYLHNVPAAVGQKVQTRLGLYVGDWFLNVNEGTPWRTRILGKYTDALRDPNLRARILGTTGVTSISTYASQLDRQTRAYSVQTTIDTAYGKTIVSTTLPPTADIDVRQGR